MSKSFSKTLLAIYRIPIVSFIVVCLFLYNFIEEALLLVAYLWQIRQIQTEEEVGASLPIISQEEIKA